VRRRGEEGRCRGEDGRCWAAGGVIEEPVTSLAASHAQPSPSASNPPARTHVSEREQRSIKEQHDACSVSTVTVTTTTGRTEELEKDAKGH
jgi:hypothetical protein